MPSSNPPLADVPTTSASHAVPWRKKIAYGVGGVPQLFGAIGVKSLAIPVYQMTLKMDPALLGLMLALPRIWDAITDPVMGFVSDRTRSRFGRRRPYIVLGAFLSAFAFAAIWMVPEHWSSTDQAWWFLATSLLFYTCHTIWAVPYSSLGYEMTPNYHERTAVMGVQATFVKIGEIFYQWVFPLAQLAIFASVMQGVRIVTVAVGVLVFLVLGLLPGLLVKERFRAPVLATTPSMKPLRPRFWSNAGDILRNQALLVLVVLTILKLLNGVFASSLDYYLLVYHMFDGDLAVGSFWKGVLSSAYAICGLAFIVPMTWFSRRFDKRATLLGVYALSVVGGGVKWLVFQPGNTWIILIDPIVSAPSWIALGLIVPSMVADICDDDEWRHGQRREGMVGALLSWIQKTGASLAFFVSGLALNIVGFDAALGGQQNPDTIFSMRLLLGGSTAAIGLLSMMVLAFYPLNERKLNAIRADLESRRGAV
jgi:Na+/melibiose symporter and related transporters